MFTDRRSIQQSGFPEIEPGKPKIFFDRVGSYPCFCVNDLYFHLFTGEKTKEGMPVDTAIISFPRQGHTVKRDRELLEYLLPKPIFDEIVNSGKNEKACIKNHDYREFFIGSTNNKKITKLLFGIFSTNERDSEKKFVERMQNHFIQILKDAEFQEPQLGSFLCMIVDKSIAPPTVSLSANAAFHSLLNSAHHDSISKAIANVFTSAMLGLYSMKYNADSEKTLGYERKRDFVFSRTYILNKLGMEFIWTPESINNSYVKLQDALYAYSCGRYRDAYELVTRWYSDKNKNESKTDATIAEIIQGICLFRHPELCDLNSPLTPSEGFIDRKRMDGISILKKCITCNNLTPETEQLLAEANYLLYGYFLESEIQEALGFLKYAYVHNHPRAVNEVVNRYLMKNKEFTNDGEDFLLKLTYLITHRELFASDGDAAFSDSVYLRAKLLCLKGDAHSGEKGLAEAAKLGHEKAMQELSRKERMDQRKFPAFSVRKDAPCCFTNSLDDTNLTILSTFPTEEWAVFTEDDISSMYSNVNKVNDIDDFIQQKLINGECYDSRIVFLFNSSDENRNLNDTLILLDKLFNIVLEASEIEKWEIIKRIDIFVGAKYETASMFIDANISGMGNDTYFRVHILDENKDAIHHLLCDAPLFIPFLKAKKEESANIVLLGSTVSNYYFIKESMACAFLGESYPITITMIGVDAERVEMKLRQECPGLYSSPRIRAIRPAFISCDVNLLDFPSIIYGADYQSNPNDSVVKALKNGNYFVVDVSNDSENIRFSMQLRTWLLRSGGAFDRTPFIAVRCTNPQNAYLSKHLTLSGQSAGESYFSRYDLHPFGVTDEIYSYTHLIKEPKLWETALRVHKSYYGENVHAAENDYYSFSYNADSSIMTAIGLCYRFFAGNVYFPDKEKYLNFGFFYDPDLVSKYSEYTKSETNREHAAALEQSRWNGFMLSRGWEPASISQVQAYKEQATGSAHKHMLAKLHPFIREWDELDDDNLKRIMGMLKAKYGYERSPKFTTLDSIDKTHSFLSTNGIITEKEK